MRILQKSYQKLRVNSYYCEGTEANIRQLLTELILVQFHVLCSI